MEKIRPLKFARHLRRNQTPAEIKLWGALRKRCLGDYRFSRQVTIGPYVVDFLCKEKALIIEIDGATHGDAHEVQHDANRTRFLISLGFEVYRTTNTDVYENFGGVLDGILIALNARDSKFQKKGQLPQ